MRTHGTLTKWNDDRGFGFITPAKSTGDLFVHVSAFPRDGVRPRINELISFEIEAGPDGKKRAVNVMRPGQRSVVRSPGAGRLHQSPGWGIKQVIALTGIVAIGAYAFVHIKQRVAPAIDSSIGVASQPRIAAAPDRSTDVVSPQRITPVPDMPASQPVSRPAAYSCDGRTMCSEMTSCAEATYFIRNCPNTRMDGDGDGEPCESQWCSN